jgi:NADH dehydrogenase (ubiquinone) 1 alpha subcomplex subunit 5
MRAAARLLASVRSGKYLEAGNPTGLTGLYTHPSPRSTLLFNYNATLDKLKRIPETSVYRQSTEALTRHRLKVIEENIPEGWDEWMQKVQKQVADDPSMYHTTKTTGGITIIAPKKREVDFREPAAAWDGEKAKPFPEGIRTQEERKVDIEAMKGDKDYKPERTFASVDLEPEPQYTVDVYVLVQCNGCAVANGNRISEIESRIGAGLIEEVIQVAEGEHKLVDEMVKAKV